MEHSKEPKWYVLHTFSGYENVAKENLENTNVDSYSENIDVREEVNNNAISTKTEEILRQINSYNNRNN